VHVRALGAQVGGAGRRGRGPEGREDTPRRPRSYVEEPSADDREALRVRPRRGSRTHRCGGGAPPRAACTAANWGSGTRGRERESEGYVEGGYEASGFRRWKYNTLV
jgi:hypothetical protein